MSMFRTLLGIKKAGYTRVKCIESTGTQYINTNIYPSTQIITEIEYAYTNNTVDNKTRIFGSRQSWNSKGYYAGTSGNSASGYMWFQLGSSYQQTTVQADKNKHKIKFGANEVYIDGTKVANLSASSFTPYNYIYLFGAYDGDASTSSVTTGICRIYSCKIYTNGSADNPLADFIPVLDTNGTPCFYDNVSQTYFYNEGTGTFLYEEIPLPDEYQEVEYIASSGSQYIDTGFNPKGDTTIEISVSNIAKNGVLFGAYDSTWTTGYGMYSNYLSDFWYHYRCNTQINLVPPTDVVMTFGKGKTTINGVQRASVSELTFTVSYPLYLFAGNWYGTEAKEPTNCKLKYAKIYDGDTLIRNYIPCYRKSDGVIGLYDNVNKEFKTNAGSGTFTKGGDV